MEVRITYYLREHASKSGLRQCKKGLEGIGFIVILEQAPPDLFEQKEPYLKFTQSNDQENPNLIVQTDISFWKVSESLAYQLLIESIKVVAECLYVDCLVIDRGEEMSDGDVLSRQEIHQFKFDTFPVIGLSGN